MRDKVKAPPLALQFPPWPLSGGQKNFFDHPPVAVQRIVGRRAVYPRPPVQGAEFETSN
jgi:hypothetical protein